VIYYFAPPPSPHVEKILQRYRTSRYSYPDVGITWLEGSTLAADAVKKYKMDRYRACLGNGAAIFQDARQRFANWKMFPSKWIRIYPEKPEMKEGGVVGILAKVLGGMWVLNLCRVVRTVIEERRVAFSYGTLEQHAERGEEKFSLAWSEGDDSVHFEILAFSRPNQLLAKLAYPYVRHLQKRFGKDAMQQMLQRERRPG